MQYLITQNKMHCFSKFITKTIAAFGESAEKKELHLKSKHSCVILFS